MNVETSSSARLSSWTARSRSPFYRRLLAGAPPALQSTTDLAAYPFTTAADVIRASDIPSGFAAVLSGHIHRHQVLETDLRGRVLPAPVLYPGSIERTSVAEADEDKGFMIIEVNLGHTAGRVDWTFHQLPARPLVRHDLQLDGLEPGQVESALRSLVASAPVDAVVSVRISGAITGQLSRVLSAAFLRSLTPPTMNLDLRLDSELAGTERPAPQGNPEVLELPL